MKNIGRNAPCWCGSKVKYKKCHLDRDAQKKELPWNAVTTNKKAFQTKKCFAHDVGLGPCEGKIVKAHTVSKGPNLSTISENGMVIQYSVDVPKLIKNGGKIQATAIGIGDASTFYGFCERHDRVLFSCIENEPFTGRAEQCLAIAYRTLSREYYTKDALSHIRETLHGADKGMSLQQQIELQMSLDLVHQGNELAKKELKHTLDKLTHEMVEKKAECLNSMIIQFNDILPFMTAGAWSPLTDLFGHDLQDGREDTLLEQIFISTFASDKISYACISWIKSERNAPGQTIAQQIRYHANDKQASAFLQLIVKHVENVFFNPTWFKNLSIKQRNQIDSLAASGIHMLGSRPEAPIDFETELNLPKVVGIFDVTH